MGEILLTLHSEEDTQKLAATLANHSRIGDVIYLKGTLGAGKSTFARAFIRSLAQNSHLDVPSPTFTLVQTYTDLSLPIWHFDLYRLDSPEEIDELGLDEALSSAISLIEWPDRLGSLILPNTLVLTLAEGKVAEERHVVLSGDLPWEKRLQEIVR